MKKWIFFITIVLIFVVDICRTIEPDKELVGELKNFVQLNKSEIKREKVAILIDYNQPVFRKRLWVIDLENEEILFNSHISHSKNSGFIYASKFSNTIGSEISSKGIFVTKNRYKSSFGKGEYQIGMRIDGLEKGINDEALKRNIVFHSSYGLWSSGCFMSLPGNNKRIIDLTEGGSLIYVNAK